MFLQVFVILLGEGGGELGTPHASWDRYYLVGYPLGATSGGGNWN